jgi:hypothetical protein
MIMAEDVQERTGGSFLILITRRKEGHPKTAEADLTAESNYS